LVALVDSDLERAKAVRQDHKLSCAVSRDYRAVMGDVDAVINALPNHLHAPVNVELLGAGIHVLCEKPIATTAADARACCEASQQKGALLAAAMPWRFRESSLLLRMVLADGLLGSLQGYDWDYGMPYDWPTASGFYFSCAQAGGGVLLDEGVHLLDCLLDWFGPATVLDYQDDNLGSGIEANVILTIRHSGRYGGVDGRVRLSRTYTLKNRLRVHGTRSVAEIARKDPSTVVLYQQVAGQAVTSALRLLESPAGMRDAFREQLENFVDSIKGTASPAVDGWNALRTIELVESCYARARRIPEPWFETFETLTEFAK
jgi:predicted dehydrogenase